MFTKFKLYLLFIFTFLNFVNVLDAFGKAQTVNNSKRSINDIMKSLKAGDTLMLEKGVYKEPLIISNIKEGQTPENPITITSFSSIPSEFAIINPNGKPGDKGTSANFGIEIIQSPGIVIENLVFSNCWPAAIRCRGSDTNYISIRGISVYGGQSVVWPERIDRSKQINNEDIDIGPHHILLENSFWQQNKDLWESSELTYDHVKCLCEGQTTANNKCIEWNYNGGIFYNPNGVGGGSYVIRNNHIKYVFNAFTFGHYKEKNTPPIEDKKIIYNSNIEIYNNRIDYVRDNLLELENAVFNVYFYNNINFNTGLGLISIDTAKGGQVYIYGNVGYINPKKRPSVADNTCSIITNAFGVGIYKFVNGKDYPDKALTKPIYIFNNTWSFGYEDTWLTTEDSNYYLVGENRFQRCVRHFNNICYLKDGLGLFSWSFKKSDIKKDYNSPHEINIFDYDFSPTVWPDSMYTTQNGETILIQEKNGTVSSEQKFVDAAEGDFRLKGGPCVDNGVEISGFTQGFKGERPDIGAYEGNCLVEGPPFKFVNPPGWTTILSKLYKERPRIVRHKISGNKLILYFSDALNKTTVNKDSILVKNKGKEIQVVDATFPNSAWELVVSLKQPDWDLDKYNFELEFTKTPSGANGEAVTVWASVLTMEPLFDVCKKDVKERCSFRILFEPPLIKFVIPVVIFLALAIIFLSVRYKKRVKG